MAKERKDKPEAEGVRFREGYYKQHGLGEGRMCSHEESMACRGIVKLVVDGKLAEVEGLERIQKILHPEVPF
jgi:hypothetical protein